MKKRLSLLLALCLTVSALVLTLPTPVSAAGATTYDLTLTYTDANVNNGIVNRRDTATLSTVTKDALSALKVVPDPAGSSSASNPVVLDHYSYGSRNLGLASLKTVSFYSYYEGSASLGKAKLSLLPGTAGTLSSTVTVTSREDIRKGEWQWLTFDVAEGIFGKVLNSASLAQFHYFPYGSVTAGSLAESDVVYIAKIRLSSTTLFDVTADYTGSITIGDKSKTVCQGLVDRQDYATTATVTVKNVDANGNEAATGVNALAVTPNPGGTNAGNTITLDHYGYATLNVPLEDVKYIAFQYCYAGSTELTGKPRLRILGSKQATIDARDAIVPGKTVDGSAVTYTWSWAFFDVGSALSTLARTDDIKLTQFHFMPYGAGVPARNLRAADVMYVSKIRLISEDLRYRMTFTPGRPDITGEKPAADAFVNVGDEVTMPQNTFARAGYSFDSYVVSCNQSYYYKEGDPFTVPSYPTGTGMVDMPPHLYVIPTFTFNKPPYKGCEPIRSVDYTDWFNSVDSLKSNGAAFAVATKDQTFDGRRVLKVTPIRDCASPRNLVLDSWQWGDLPWNMDYYKYATVEYYFDTANNILSSFKPQLRLLTTSLNASSQTVTAKETVTAGKWAILNFDLSSLNLSTGIETGRHMMRQTHFVWQPTGSNVTQFAQGTTLYIGRFTLYHEKPPVTPQLVENYMDGDPDGAFRPHDTLTKAESAQILYNILKLYSPSTLPASVFAPFSDVTDPSLWYYTSVASMAKIGVIPAAAPLFSPNAPITRKELAVYIQNLLLKLDGAGIAGDSLFDAGDAVTREEAVSIFNRFVLPALGREMPEDFSACERVTHFCDVHPDTWSYADIVAAACRRVSAVSNGVETPFVLLTDTIHQKNDPDAYDVFAGNAKIAEIDAQTDARIAAIRATPNTVDPSAVTSGTVYYLSTSSGSTSSAGTSASSPRRINALSDVNTKVGSATIKSGDVLLFKRGDTFRGTLTAVAGVTYSAYGTGNKPVFIRNTETAASNAASWTLDYQNGATGAKIWKYTANTALTDVGAVLLINGGDITVAYKEIPSYFNGQWWTRGSSNTVAFDYKTELDRDLEFVQLDPPGGTSGHSGPTTGPLYLRCDAGNPGSVYATIEFNLKSNCVSAKSGVTIDNICIKYFGSHGIGAGSVRDLTVTNCEVGWGGGAIQYFNMDSTGAVTRFGNGIEVYGGCENYTIENCYVYQIYDAGITHQISSTSGGNYYMGNVLYANNVLEYSTYNIEYFNSPDTASSATERFMKDISIDGNIIRKAGYGWGIQRTDNAPSNIKGWANSNNKAIDFTVTNNVLDRTFDKVHAIGTNDWLAQVGCGYLGCEPYFSGNTFIQVPGRLFVYSAKTNYKFDRDLAASAEEIGAENNAFFFCAEGEEEASVAPVYRGTIR